MGLMKMRMEMETSNEPDVMAAFKKKMTILAKQDRLEKLNSIINLITP